MKKFIFNRSVYWLYLTFILWAIIIFLVNNLFSVAPWTMMLTFFLLLCLPGFSLARIFKINFKKDALGQLILWLTIGLIWTLIISGFAIVLGLTINALLFVYFGLILLIFILSFILELPFFAHRPDLNFSFKEIFKPQNSLGLWLVFLSIFVLITSSIKGSLFTGGDPAFHLSIIRKAFENQPLTVENLSYVKGEAAHITYGIPIWHVFLALLAKLFKVDIFTLYGEVSMSLSALAILIWYFLLRKIFPSRNLAYLAFALFIAFVFYYPFTVLVLPDSLNQFLLFPLSIALALKYIFEKQDYKVLIVLSVLVVLMGAIHLTQYFYFIFAMLLFVLIYILFKFREKDFKNIIFRILKVTFANLIFLVPFALFLESQGRVISSALKSSLAINETRKLRYATVKHFWIMTKLAFLGLPLFFLFIKKYRRLIFLVAFFLLVPVTYSVFLRYKIMKILGYIFLNRLYGNVTWHFAIWALVLGFILILLNRLVTKINSFCHYCVYLVNFFLAIIFGWSLWAEGKYQTISSFYSQVFSDSFDQWLNIHFEVVLISLMILVLVILIFQHFKPKVAKFFNLEESNNYLFNFLITSVLIFFFISPKIELVTTVLKDNNFQNKFLTNPGYSDAVDLKEVGGAETLNFIKNYIPAKSVFIVNKSRNAYLAMLADQFIMAYPHSAEEAKYNKIFQDKISFEQKLEYLQSSKIEYIMLVDSSGQTYFDQYPEYFKKIFSDDTKIYQVNQAAINRVTKI